MLADDHAPTRLGVRLALEEGGFQVVAEAADARGAVEAVLEHNPDLCLLDVYMPGEGIAAAAELSEALPELPIVMLSVSDTDEDLFEALRAGACGYLLKDTDPRRLPHGAQRGARRRGAAAARAHGEADHRVPPARTRASLARRPRRLVTLSERESEVLELLRAELTTKQIAHRLGISPVTVRRHLSDVLKKLRVSATAPRRCA